MDKIVQELKAAGYHVVDMGHTIIGTKKISTVDSKLKISYLKPTKKK